VSAEREGDAGIDSPRSSTNADFFERRASWRQWPFAGSALNKRLIGRAQCAAAVLQGAGSES
jgi:hypothetical protein